MKLTLLEKKHETPDVITFKFKPDSSIPRVPGQFIQYTLPHPDPDNRGIKRFFSISSAPHEDTINITSRFAKELGSSFKSALKNLEQGDTIEAGEPEGDFVLGDPRLEYVLIAGGVGITPYRAMLMDLAQKQNLDNITLVYGNRDNNIIFKNELEKLAQEKGLKLVLAIDPELINEDLIKKHVRDVTKPIFYVSGPEPMVEAFEEWMLKIGIPKEHLKQDFFPGYEKY